MTRLGDVAHARAGDKGDTSILGLFVYRRQDYDRVRRAVSVSRLAGLFGVEPESVRVVEVPHQLAFSISVGQLLDGGVTRSLRPDPHGKCLSGVLLDLEVPW